MTAITKFKTAGIALNAPAILCSTLQHPTSHCNTLQHPAMQCTTPQHTATHCNTLQPTATHCNTLTAVKIKHGGKRIKHTCNTLQHTATHYNTPQRTATHCNTLQHTATHCKPMQHTNSRQEQTRREVHQKDVSRPHPTLLKPRCVISRENRVAGVWGRCLGGTKGRGVRVCVFVCVYIEWGKGGRGSGICVCVYLREREQVS